MCFLCLQNLDEYQGNIFRLIFLSFFLLVALAVSQLPSVLVSERIAALVSFLTVFVFAVVLFLIASSQSTPLLFALLLAVHAMLPISRIASFAMTGILLTSYVILCVMDAKSTFDGQFYRQVSSLISLFRSLLCKSLLIIHAYRSLK